MRNVQLEEKINPRYVHVDADNVVHVMVPISASGGTEIGTDNTCKAMVALQEFFGKKHDSHIKKDSALDALLAFRKSLEEDLSKTGLLTAQDRSLKQDRLQQVNDYIDILTQMVSDYSLSCLGDGLPTTPEPVRQILQGKRSNLYGMLLRPPVMDWMVKTENPIFSVQRPKNGNEDGGGILYDALKRGLSKIQYPSQVKSHAKKLAEAILGPETESECTAIACSQDANEGKYKKIIALICSKLSDKYKEMYPQMEALKFTLGEGTAMTYSAFSDFTSIEDVRSLAESIVVERNSTASIFPSPPCFYDCSITANGQVDEKKLIVMTQFLLAEINFYLHARRVTREDFGKCLELEKNSTLLRTFVEQLRDAYERGQDIETCVCRFIHNESRSFGLQRGLNDGDLQKITHRFNSHFSAVKDHIHFDDFRVLEPEIPGDFFLHQAGICFDFSEFFTPLRKHFPAHTHMTIARAQSKIAARSLSVVLPARAPEAVGSITVEKAKVTAEIHSLIQCFIALTPAPQPPYTSDVSKLYHLIRNYLLATTTLSDGAADKKDEKKVFEWLGQDFFRGYDNPQARQLFLDIRTHITDAQVSQSFNKIVRGQDTQLLLTPDNCRQLYTGLIAKTPYTVADGTQEMTEQYSTKDALEKMMSFMGLANITITPGCNGTFIIDTIQGNITTLNAMIEAGRNAFHLSPEIAASLYKEVGLRFGVESEQYQSMERAGNKGRCVDEAKATSKMQIALNLLHIRTQFDYPNNNINRNGYILKNLTPEMIETILGIHTAQSKRYTVTPKIVDALCSLIPHSVQLYAPQGDFIVCSSLPMPYRLEMALHLLSITFKRVECLQDGNYCVFLDEREKSKISIISRERGINPPDAPEPTSDEEKLLGYKYKVAYRPVTTTKDARGSLIRNILSSLPKASAPGPQVVTAATPPIPPQFERFSGLFPWGLQVHQGMTDIEPAPHGGLQRGWRNEAWLVFDDENIARNCSEFLAKRPNKPIKGGNGGPKFVLSWNSRNIRLEEPPPGRPIFVIILTAQNLKDLGVTPESYIKNVPHTSFPVTLDPVVPPVSVVAPPVPAAALPVPAAAPPLLAPAFSAPGAAFSAPAFAFPAQASAFPAPAAIVPAPVATPQVFTAAPVPPAAASPVYVQTPGFPAPSTATGFSAHAMPLSTPVFSTPSESAEDLDGLMGAHDSFKAESYCFPWGGNAYQVSHDGVWYDYVRLEFETEQEAENCRYYLGSVYRVVFGELDGPGKPAAKKYLYQDGFSFLLTREHLTALRIDETSDPTRYLLHRAGSACFPSASPAPAVLTAMGKPSMFKPPVGKPFRFNARTLTLPWGGLAYQASFEGRWREDVRLVFSTEQVAKDCSQNLADEYGIVGRGGQAKFVKHYPPDDFGILLTKDDLISLRIDPSDYLLHPVGSPCSASASPSSSTSTPSGPAATGSSVPFFNPPSASSQGLCQQAPSAAGIQVYIDKLEAYRNKRSSTGDRFGITLLGGGRDKGTKLSAVRKLIQKLRCEPSADDFTPAEESALGEGELGGIVAKMRSELPDLFSKEMKMNRK